jgi:copper chaperone
MKTTLHVKGMSCGHCVSSVKGALEQLNGITSVEVNLDDGKVDVTYNDSQVTVEEMSNTIEDQGYNVV